MALQKGPKPAETSVLKSLEFCRISSKVPNRMIRRFAENRRLIYSQLVIPSDLEIRGYTGPNPVRLGELGMVSFMDRCIYEELSNYKDRLQTFYDLPWPPVLRNIASKLAHNGMFFKGTGSEARCYCCGVGVDSFWICQSEEEEAWMVQYLHFCHFPRCKLNKVLYSNPLWLAKCVRWDVACNTHQLLHVLEELGSPEHQIQYYKDMYESEKKEFLRTGGLSVADSKSSTHQPSNSTDHASSSTVFVMEDEDDESTIKPTHLSEQNMLILHQSKLFKENVSMKKMLRTLKHDLLCGICNKEPRNTTYLPCSHSFACESCMRTNHPGVGRHTCVVCRSNVIGYLHAYTDINRDVLKRIN